MIEVKPEGDMAEPAAAASSSLLASSTESPTMNPWTSTDRSSPPPLSINSSTTTTSFTPFINEEDHADSDYDFDTDGKDPLDGGDWEHELRRRHSRDTDVVKKEDDSDIDEEETTACQTSKFFTCFKQTTISIMRFSIDILRRIPRKKLLTALFLCIAACRASTVSTTVEENGLSEAGIDADVEHDVSERKEEILADLTNVVANAVLDKITEQNY